MTLPAPCSPSTAGLTVKQLKELRTALGGNATYAVVKNTLTKIAAKDAGVEGLSDLLAGPSAIAFITGDPVETAKGLRDFAKANPQLLIKGGVLDGKSLSPAEIDKLASLESREVLLAKLAGAMKASLSGAAALFAAPLSQTARVLGALQEKAQQDPSVLAGGAGTPAPAAAEAPVDGGGSRRSGRRRRDRGRGTCRRGSGSRGASPRRRRRGDDPRGLTAR